MSLEARTSAPTGWLPLCTASPMLVYKAFYLLRLPRIMTISPLPLQRTCIIVYNRSTNFFENRVTQPDI